MAERHAWATSSAVCTGWVPTTLPVPEGEEVAGVLRQGREAKVLDFAGSPLEAARVLIAALEGAERARRSWHVRHAT